MNIQTVSLKTKIKTYDMLVFEGMKLAISQGHFVRVIFMVMGECAVTLGDVEAEHGKSNSTRNLLHEGSLLLMGDLSSTLSCEQVVLVLVELLLDLSTEHI